MLLCICRTCASIHKQIVIYRIDHLIVYGKGVYIIVWADINYIATVKCCSISVAAGTVCYVQVLRLYYQLILWAQ